MDAHESTAKFDEACGLFKEGRHAEALLLLGELDRAFPNNAKIMYPAALCMEKMGQTDNALALCDRLITQFQHQGAQELKNRLASPVPDVPSFDLGGIDDILGAEPSKVPPPVMHESTNYKPLIRILVAVLAIGGLAAAAVFVAPLISGLGGSSPVTVQDMVDSVSQEQYTEYQLAIESMGLGIYGGPEYNMGFRCRDYDKEKRKPTPGNEEACKYIKDKFEDMGLKTTLQGKYLNVVGEITGKKTPDKIYIFGAHYDHVKGDMPGGDDNASGTAALLETARVLSKFNFESTIHLVAFNAEEDGMLGSKDYVAKVAKGQNVVGMINMDMILRPGSDARPDRPIDIEADSNGSMEWVQSYVQAVADYVPSLVMGEITNDQESLTDNDAFQSAGIPAMLVIENSWGDWYPPNPVANPYYHHYEDASDRKANNPDDSNGVRYDYAFATDVTRGAVAVLAQEAKIIN